MHLIRDRITLTSTGTTGITAYSAVTFNGLVHAITYSTALAGAPPTTAAITVQGSRWGIDYLTGVALAASKTLHPRELSVETSGASTAAIYPTELFPVVDERIQVDVAGCTSALVPGTCYVDLWVQG